jgi:hypothetical protein
VKSPEASVAAVELALAVALEAVVIVEFIFVADAFFLSFLGCVLAACIWQLLFEERKWVLGFNGRFNAHAV